jgi:hypothetical protein
MLCLGSRCQRIGSAGKRDQEGLALGVHFVPVVRSEGCPQQRLVQAQRGRIVVAQLLEQAGGALDVGEQKGDGAAGQRGPGRGRHRRWRRQDRTGVDRVRTLLAASLRSADTQGSGEEGGAHCLGHPQRIGQQAHGGWPGRGPPAPLQVAQPAGTHPGACGQLLLAQPRCQPVPLEEHPKGRRGRWLLAHGVPVLFCGAATAPACKHSLRPIGSWASVRILAP